MDSAIARTNDKEVKEQDIPVPVDKTCQRCHTTNSVTLIYCSKCALPLDISQIDKDKLESRRESARGLVLEITGTPSALKYLLGNVKLSEEEKKRLVESL